MDASPNRFPDVTIEYCVPCAYRERAEALRDALQREYSVEARLIEGRAGAFEVTLNGELIFSKRATTRFPEHDEIFYHVKEALPDSS